MTNLFVLFEHAAGYALFKVKEFEEAGMLSQQVEASVTDLNNFNRIVKLIAFTPFKNSVAALENVNCISEGSLHEDLKSFIEIHILKGGKKRNIVLGVSEPKLGSSITETLGIISQTKGVIPEIVRGIRLHFPNLVKGLNTKAQLGLGHSYSHAKIKMHYE